MAVRKTESRIAQGFSAGELGQTVMSDDGKCILISYQTTPIAVGRIQTYVVFVLDRELQESIRSYEWIVYGNSTKTLVGVNTIVPFVEGVLDITVNLLGESDVVLCSLRMIQVVLYLNAQLEGIVSSEEEVASVAGDPEVSRGLINDVAVYIDRIVSRIEGEEQLMNKLIFSIAYAEIMNAPDTDRKNSIDKMAEALEEEDHALFTDLACTGVGICQLRPHVVAMYVSKTVDSTDWIIAQREFPGDDNGRAILDSELKQNLTSLDMTSKIDLFNLLRFPKTNLRLTLQFVESLKEQYFPDTTLTDIFNNKEQLLTLISQFKEGPYKVS